MEDILRLIYYFARGFEYDTHNEIKNLGKSDTSRETIVYLSSCFNEVSILIFDRVIHNNGPIVHHGKCIELNEIK